MVSSTLLLSALSTTYSMVPDRSDVMGKTFAGILDAAASEFQSCGTTLLEVLTRNSPGKPRQLY